MKMKYFTMSRVATVQKKNSEYVSGSSVVGILLRLKPQLAAPSIIAADLSANHILIHRRWVCGISMADLHVTLYSDVIILEAASDIFQSLQYLWKY